MTGINHIELHSALEELVRLFGSSQDVSFEHALVVFDRMIEACPSEIKTVEAYERRMLSLTVKSNSKCILVREKVHNDVGAILSFQRTR